MSEPSPYRRAAGPDGRTEVARPCLRGSRRSAAFLGSVAASGATAAVVASSAEMAVLAGLSVVAAAGHWARGWRARRRHDGLRLFLGDGSIREQRGSWTSLDGRRRVRVRSGDPLARFEEMDPASGQTLRSLRGPAPVAPPAPPERPALERWARPVRGRALRPCCFFGLPPELGGRDLALVEPRLVVIDVRVDGVLVTRRDVHGELVGDTWHADCAAAQRQLEAEFGAHLGPPRPPDEVSAPARPVEAGWDPGRSGDRLAL